MKKAPPARTTPSVVWRDALFFDELLEEGVVQEIERVEAGDVFLGEFSASAEEGKEAAEESSEGAELGGEKGDLPAQSKHGAGGHLFHSFFPRQRFVAPFLIEADIFLYRIKFFGVQGRYSAQVDAQERQYLSGRLSANVRSANKRAGWLMPHSGAVVIKEYPLPILLDATKVSGASR